MQTDSFSLFNAIVNTSCTAEKRLIIDLAAAREAYDKYEIHDIWWVDTISNIADAFTKPGSNNNLEALLDTGKFDHDILEWVLCNSETNDDKDLVSETNDKTGKLPSDQH